MIDTSFLSQRRATFFPRSFSSSNSF
jgi:hypothetical protein